MSSQVLTLHVLPQAERPGIGGLYCLRNGACLQNGAVGSSVPVQSSLLLLSAASLRRQRSARRQRLKKTFKKRAMPVAVWAHCPTVGPLAT